VFNSFNRAGAVIQTVVVVVVVCTKQFAIAIRRTNVSASHSGFGCPSTSFTFFTCFQRCTSPMLTSGRSTQ